MAYLLVKVIILFYVELFRWLLWYLALWGETLQQLPRAVRRPKKPPKVTISALYSGKCIVCTCSDGRVQRVPFQDGLTLGMALEIVALEIISGPYVIYSGPTAAVLVQE